MTYTRKQIEDLLEPILNNRSSVETDFNSSRITKERFLMEDGA